MLVINKTITSLFLITMLRNYYFRQFFTTRFFSIHLCSGTTFFKNCFNNLLDNLIFNQARASQQSEQQFLKCVACVNYQGKDLQFKSVRTTLSDPLQVGFFCHNFLYTFIFFTFSQSFIRVLSRRIV